MFSKYRTVKIGNYYKLRKVITLALCWWCGLIYLSRMLPTVQNKILRIERKITYHRVKLNLNKTEIMCPGHLDITVYNINLENVQYYNYFEQRIIPGKENQATMRSYLSFAVLAFEVKYYFFNVKHLKLLDIGVRYTIDCCVHEIKTH